MKDFAALFAALDTSTRTNDKVDALVRYFLHASDEDAAWAVYFLIGNRPKQAVPSQRLQAIAAQAAGMPLWLFEESYDTVGDLAETIALILPAPSSRHSLSLHEWIESRILNLRDQDDLVQQQSLLACWDALDVSERFVFNKLITGGFRVGVAQSVVARAIAQIADVDAKVIAHRLAGTYQPTSRHYRALLSGETETFDRSKPYPFFLAHALEGDPSQLGDCGLWQAEWKWDGIRGQLVKRHGEIHLWSRGEELITAQFPEIVDAARSIEDAVIDGEILPMKDGRVLSFAHLQKRLGRKSLSKKLLADYPVVFMAYDLLERHGEDWRARPLHERRVRLHEIICGLPQDAARARVLQLSDIVRAPSWATLARARADAKNLGTEGLMLKRRDSAYGVGRAKGDTGGDWWKWKVAPYTIDCVLMYAQRGHGKRANLYTDYTFGVWNHAKSDDEYKSESTHHAGNENTTIHGQNEAKMPESARQLVTFAKAYSGLSDAEIREVDAFIRKNTLEKFGPVRTVKFSLVFELAFEAIAPSNRHKSGFAVRFPRIARLRSDKSIEDADSIDTIRALIEQH